MPFVLEKIMMAEVSSNSICGKITVIAECWYLHYHREYGYQTWQYGLTIQVIWPFDHVVLPETTWRTKIIPLCQSFLITTKLGGVVTYFKGLLPIKSLGFWVTWSCEITWQFKKNSFPLPQCLSPAILARLWLTSHKVVRPFDQVFLQNHVTNQIIISLLPKYHLEPQNLTGCLLTLRESYV